jgi:hypothetical protein
MAINYDDMALNPCDSCRAYADEYTAADCLDCENNPDNDSRLRFSIRHIRPLVDAIIAEMEVRHVIGREITVADAFDDIELRDAAKEYPSLEKHCQKTLGATEKARLIVQAAAWYWLKNDNLITKLCAPLSFYPELGISAGLIGKPEIKKSDKEISRKLNRDREKLERTKVKGEKLPVKSKQAKTKPARQDKPVKVAAEYVTFDAPKYEIVPKKDERKEYMMRLAARMKEVIAAFYAAADDNEGIALLDEYNRLMLEYEYFQTRSIKAIRTAAVVCHNCNEDITPALEYYFQAAIIKTCRVPVHNMRPAAQGCQTCG